MRLISSLNRSEETATPSCPLLLTTTAEPVTAVPLIPAIKDLLWVPCVPTRVVLASAATPALPISILLLPIVRLPPALAPKAMLELPVVLRSRELTPRATLRLPAVLEKRALTPKPALFLPAVLLLSACKPSAVLLLPVLLLKSALKPLA